MKKKRKGVSDEELIGSLYYELHEQGMRLYVKPDRGVVVEPIEAPRAEGTFRGLPGVDEPHWIGDDGK